MAWRTSIVPARRHVRNRPWTGGHLGDSLARDERLLKKLEDQLERVKAKIKLEEEEKENKIARGERVPEDVYHAEHIWNDVLTDQDRVELTKHGISTFDDLYELYDAAEKIMKRPPHPPLKRLEERLQVAHRMYDSIPAKIADIMRASHHKGVWW